MRNNIKVISGYINGNKLIRYAISSKIILKISKKTNYYRLSHDRIRQQIDINFLRKMQTITIEEKNNYLNNYYNFLGTDWKFWGQDITWNKDVLSDYIFKKEKFSSTLIDDLPTGVDIKIPWEMGRMQHWPQLAIYAVNNEKDIPEIIFKFQQQIEDFMEKNPIGKGVHFYCAMEIAIRAINLLITYDILYQLNEKLFKSNFISKLERMFQSYFYEIIGKLEKNIFDDHAGNHYLADLTGLLWICLYFKGLQEKWGRYVIEEYKKEIERQFVEDGFNFECSSGYHILSTELILLGLVAIQNFNCDIDIESERDVLKKALSVADMLFLKNGNLVLIGDYDSGRVLKLLPNYQGKNIENCLQILDIRETMQDNEAFEYRSYTCLLNAYNSRNLIENSIKFKDNRESIKKMISFNYKNAQYIKTYEVSVNTTFEEKQIFFFREFGLIKIISDNVEIYIRCVPDYKKMDISHAHNDVFSYQIFEKDQALGVDLGSISYTAYREVRKLFASDKSHNMPIHEKKILDRNNVFSAQTNAVGDCYYDNNLFVVAAKWSGIWHIREFELGNKVITIRDFSNDNYRVNIIKDQYQTYGYGQLYRRDSNEHIRTL